MKKLKTYNVYKASNVILNMDKLEAYSYDWYLFLKDYNGTLVLNEHRYSPTTGRHIAKVKGILNQLGIEYITVNIKDSLNALGYGTLIESINKQIDDYTRLECGARKNKGYYSELILERRKVLNHLIILQCSMLDSKLKLVNNQVA